jgi:Leucine-rich repeat (LRR) protein
MDDSDEALLIIPDSRGQLDLTNRAWVNLDSQVFSFASSLVLLDISYNNMHELPVEIGELQMLRELRAAFNKLVKVPQTIGKLRRLRKLVLNGNKLKTLPDEIGRLDQLEELIISENRLTYFPSAVKHMSSLAVLKLQNNDLVALPPELSEGEAFLPLCFDTYGLLSCRAATLLLSISGERNMLMTDGSAVCGSLPYRRVSCVLSWLCV